MPSPTHGCYLFLNYFCNKFGILAAAILMDDDTAFVIASISLLWVGVALNQIR